MAPTDATWRRRDPAETPAPEGSFPSSRSEWTANSSPNIRTDSGSARPAPALHAIPANVAVIDSRGQIVAANEAWQGRPAALFDALLTGAVDSYEMEYPAYGPAGQRWYRLMVSPMSIDGGAGGGVVMQADITARKEAEIAMLRAEAQARVADQAKTDFLSNLSHELRTPLNAVIGFAQMLEAGVAGTLSGKQAEYVHDIRASGAHLLRLIDNLLDLSPTGPGAAPSATDVVSLAEAIADARRLLEGAALAKGCASSSAGLTPSRRSPAIL